MHTLTARSSRICKFFVEAERAPGQDQRVTRVLASAAAALVVCAASSAIAAPSCKSISVTPLAFGTYDVYNATPTDSAGTNFHLWGNDV